MGYSQEVIDFFIDPENEGEMKDADAVGQSENRESILCRIVCVSFKKRPEGFATV